MTKKDSRVAPTNSTPFPIPGVLLAHHHKTLQGSMREWQSRKSIPPVLLLTGQSGIGKRAIAYFLSQWILCSHTHAASPGEPHLHPCGKCSFCLRVLAGNEPNLVEITSESDDDSSSPGVHGSLKIEQFRKLKTTAGFAAQDGRFQLTLIPNADRMTVQAANSILKLLEETPKGWVFILSTNDPTLLLPTLVSRCQILRLKPLAEEDLKNLLHSIEAPHERIDACAQMAQGSWTRAQTYASDEYWEKRKTILQFLKDPPSATLSLMDWASQDPFHFEALLDCLEQFTAELLHLNIQEKLSDNPELNAHAKTLIRSKGNSHAAREFWFERAENLAQARQSIHLPLNRKLQIQNILLPWIGAFS